MARSNSRGAPAEPRASPIACCGASGILQTIIEKFSGGPVGIETLAVAVSEERDTIEDVYEPFLIQLGFLARTPRGRVATRLAYGHFGLVPPPHTQGELWTGGR
jgi:Holliday junction DNA helicase RuvB